MAFDDHHLFVTLAALGWANLIAIAPSRGDADIHKSFRFLKRTVISQRVGKAGQHIAQRFLLAPVLKVTMCHSVLSITLRQHLRLGSSIENPGHASQNLAGEDSLATQSTWRIVLVRKMFPDAVPVFVA
jgi:hypothetical protein